jgi:ATP-dependent RNA helicase CshB
LTELTKIQEQALPYALNNKSLIIISQTGTGKTLCYLLPLLNRLNFNERRVQAVIVLPTKELARQISSKILQFKSVKSELRSTLVIGNQDINKQIQSIKNNPPQIVVGTVTRVLDLIKNRTINRDINIFVLDESDMLLDMGFNKQVNEIFQFVDSSKLQKIACSATTHYSLANHLKRYLGNIKVIIANNNSI